MVYLPRITVIELYNYREWTESLGTDREWIIQFKQSEIHSLLQRLIAKNDGFVLPFRYDYYIVLSNTISEKRHEEIYTALYTTLDVPIRMVSLTNRYPFTAQLWATRILARSHNKFIYIHGDEDPNVVVHIDINDIVKKSYSTSIYEAYVAAVELYHYIVEVVSRCGGLAGYLGGDNVLAILPLDSYEDFLDKLPNYVKAGVGISLIPRRAVKLSTEALDAVRAGGRLKKFIILTE
ncbi:MAG: GTP cyclohydrolase IIa [Desulfurococcaceae archaeon]